MTPLSGPGRNSRGVRICSQRGHHCTPITITKGSVVVTAAELLAAELLRQPRGAAKMTDTLHALFNRTWLLDCDACGDRVRLRVPEHGNPAQWQTVVNQWRAEHHGHAYLDSAPSTMHGPVAALAADVTLNRCEARR